MSCCWNKKGMVIGIFFLFILVGLSSSVSSKYLSCSEENILEPDSNFKSNNDIEPFDTYKEIFTKIGGFCYNYKVHSRKLLVRNISFYAGGSCLDIKGWCHPFPSYFHKRPTLLHAGFFIGYMIEQPWGGEYSIYGIALGNIGWYI